MPEIRADVADGLGEIQALDAMLGVLLDRLAESGEMHRTLIVLSGDHGMAGVPRGKCNLYDFGTAVPLIIAGPGVAAVSGGRVTDDFTLLMDLAPTFLETAGVALPPGMDGKSLVPVLRHPFSGQADPARTGVVTGRERHVQDAREGNVPYPQRALRTREFLYIRNYEPDRWPMGDPGGLTENTAPDGADVEKSTFATFAPSPLTGLSTISRLPPLSALRVKTSPASTLRGLPTVAGLKLSRERIVALAEIFYTWIAYRALDESFKKISGLPAPPLGGALSLREKIRLFLIFLFG